jgi:MFS family permease
MGRAILAGVALGVVAALLFVFHDSVQLSVAWPVLLGFALWGTVGRRGSRAAMTAVAAAIGVALGYATFALVAELLPPTDTSLGIAVGVAVAVLVAAGLMLRHRLPVAGLLLGYAAYFGVFEPRWTESPASIRTHGIEDLTVAMLGVLVGILAATLIRTLTDVAGERRSKEEEEARPMPTRAPEGAVMKGSA